MSTSTTLDAIREAYRAIAATQDTLVAAYHAAERETRGARLHAADTDRAAREARDAVAERRADLAAAERVARVAESAAEAARQKERVAQVAESAAQAAQESNRQAVVVAADALAAVETPLNARQATPAPEDDAMETTCTRQGHGRPTRYPPPRREAHPPTPLPAGLPIGRGYHG